MEIEIKELEKKDFNLARKFAIDGMHLSCYVHNNIELYLYSKYIWYLELLSATKTYCAYMGKNLTGFLLVNISNKPKIYKSFWYKTYIKFAEWFLYIVYKNSSESYNNANKEMMEEFVKRNKPDGEIVFFAIAPEMKGKGIGTLLLNELCKDENGRHIYAYTDSNCDYHFYLKKGFSEFGKREIPIDFGKNKTSLTCFLYSKVLNKDLP